MRKKEKDREREEEACERLKTYVFQFLGCFSFKFDLIKVSHWEGRFQVRGC